MQSPPRFESPKRQPQPQQITKRSERPIATTTAGTASLLNMSSVRQNASNYSAAATVAAAATENSQIITVNQFQPVETSADLLNGIIFGGGATSYPHHAEQLPYTASNNHNNILRQQLAFSQQQQQQQQQQHQQQVYNYGNSSAQSSNTGFTPQGALSGKKNLYAQQQSQQQQQQQQQFTYQTLPVQESNWSGSREQESSWQLVREQLRQIKQLSSDHLLATQECARLRSTNEEALNENSNLKHQVIILEQKMILYEKESASKLQALREKAKSFEIFNKDLQSKISVYEQALVQCESEMQSIREKNYYLIDNLEDEKDYLKKSLDTLNDNMNEALAQAEVKYRQKLDIKNAKIKELKASRATEQELIESYQNELVQLQAENKQLKDQLEAYCSELNARIYENEELINKLSQSEGDAKAQFDQADDLRRRLDENQQKMNAVLSSQQSDGDDRMKALYQLNQQQIAQLIEESKNLDNAMQGYQQQCQQLEQELKSAISSTNSAFTSILLLIDTKGKEEDEGDEGLESGFFASELFEEVKGQVMSLLAQKHTLKKKKKGLMEKNQEQKELIEELKNTQHSLIAERQQEILMNEQHQHQQQYQQVQQMQLQHIMQQQLSSTVNGVQSHQQSKQSHHQQQQSHHHQQSYQESEMMKRGGEEQHRQVGMEDLNSKYKKQIEEILELEKKQCQKQIQESLKSMRITLSDESCLIYVLVKIIGEITRRLQGQQSMMRWQNSLIWDYASSVEPSVTLTSKQRANIRVKACLRAAYFTIILRKGLKQKLNLSRVNVYSRQLFNQEIMNDRLTRCDPYLVGVLRSISDLQVDGATLDRTRNLLDLKCDEYDQPVEFPSRIFEEVLKISSGEGKIRIGGDALKKSFPKVLLKYRAIGDSGQTVSVDIEQIVNEKQIIEAENIELKQRLVEMQGKLDKFEEYNEHVENINQKDITRLLNDKDNSSSNSLHLIESELNLFTEKAQDQDSSFHSQNLPRQVKKTTPRGGATRITEVRGVGVSGTGLQEL